jgi:hypothetical protein
VDKTFSVAKDAEVSIDGGKSKAKGKPLSLDDVPLGASVTLRLSSDQKSATAIRAEAVSLDGVAVKAVDGAKNTITVSVVVAKGQPAVDKTYPVMAEVVVVVDGRDEIVKLNAVPIGALVNLRLLPDQKTVREIRAYGPTIAGTVHGNAGNDLISIGNKTGDKTFAVAKDGQIVIDGKKPGKLTDLIDGTVATLRLSADQSAVLDIRAEGPTYQGKVKVVDADKHIITLTINAKKGEDKDFTLTKDTVVVTEIYSVPLKLADLKVDREVLLRLSLDQKVVVKITLRGE